MKKLIIASFAALLTMTTLSANAAAPNRANEKLGWSCKTPSRGSGIVAGFFRGWKQTPFQNWGSGLMPVESFRCFKNLKQCQLWLHTMNYYYNEKTPDARMCTVF